MRKILLRPKHYSLSHFSVMHTHDQNARAEAVQELSVRPWPFFSGFAQSIAQVPFDVIQHTKDHVDRQVGLLRVGLDGVQYFGLQLVRGRKHFVDVLLVHQWFQALTASLKNIRLTDRQPFSQ